jgi:hypothetical protein
MSYQHELTQPSWHGQSSDFSLVILDKAGGNVIFAIDSL